MSRRRLVLRHASLAAAGLALLALFLPRPAAADSARDLIERGRYRAARAMVEPRIAANPDDAEAQWLLSRILSAFREEDRAIVAAEKAIALDPGRAEYHTQLAMVVGQQAQRAGMFKGLGLARRFKKEAEIALALDPKQWDARIALILFNLEAPGVVGGDKKRALAFAEESPRLDAAEGWMVRARYASEVRDTNRLEGFYRKALAANPRSYDAHIALAALLAQRSDWSGAELEAKLAREADPGRAAAYSVLAQIYAKTSRWSDLDAVIVSAASAVPGNLSPQYAAARVAIAAGIELPRAEAWLRGYLAAEPEGGTPPHAGAHWRLGNLFEKQGKQTEALAEYRAALQLDPKLQGAKRDLERLKKS